MTRRDFMLAAGATVAFRDETLNMVEKAMRFATKDIDDGARDEEFWTRIQESFALDRNVVNFNNGGCSPSPSVVMECVRRQQEFSNQAPSYYMWQFLEPEIESVRKRLAATFGCDTEEMAITRNASESLTICLMGLPFASGDELLTTVFDYPRNIMTMRQMERRWGVKMVQVKVPAVPKSPRELVDAFARGITDKTKIILVSHVTFCNGQIFPVREICALGKKHGIPVIVDGAHAFAQFPFKRDDFDCDYYATSLHKWLMAPIGTGFLYVRQKHISDVWSLMSSSEEQHGNIRKYEEIGTHPAAIHNAIGEALAFHETIGVERKAARLRYLRKRWTDKLRDEPKMRWFTNLEPEHSCGLTVVAIDGIKPGDLSSWLMTKHNIYTVGIQYDIVDGLRVTPNVYSTIGEIDRFSDAMLHAARHGIA